MWVLGGPLCPVSASHAGLLLLLLELGLLLLELGLLGLLLFWLQGGF